MKTKILRTQKEIEYDLKVDSPAQSSYYRIKNFWKIMENRVIGVNTVWLRLYNSSFNMNK